ncbi:MAG: hypothetical protein JWP88_2222 [Flaviaesturariibacter sp.]|nr:hypothetical protein [Flaviaesturariibacter sp.]
MLVVLIGYVASVLLALSLLVTNDLQFRWFNLFGCLAFIVYGILINAFPVLLTNALLFLINLYYLVKIYRTEEAFDLVEFGRGDELISKFLRFYQKDIALYFPHFKPEQAGAPISFVVLRDMVIANIFVATVDAEGTGTVLINYTIPKYRDYQVGTFIFEKEKGFLISKGVKRLVYTQPLYAKHESFIKRMGFAPEVAGAASYYTKHLA